MILPTRKLKNNAGQALILVLLGMAVVLTLVLSVVSSSVTDIDISTKDEESTRALNAAEAGVEQSFLIADDTSGSFSNDSSFSAEVTGIAQSETQYSFPRNVATGESAVMWYVSHDGTDLRCDAAAGFPCVSISAGSTLRVCFSESGTAVSEAPAVELSFYYDPSGLGINGGNFSNTRVARAVYDPNPSRALVNNFQSASGGNCSLGNKSYEFSTPAFNLSDLNISCINPNCLLFVKAKPLYNNLAQPVGFESSDPLPSQGVLVTSTGTSGDSTRKLEVYRSYKNVPPVFDSAVFSSFNLVK